MLESYNILGLEKIGSDVAIKRTVSHGFEAVTAAMRRGRRIVGVGALNRP
jgi:hypothetical protein